MASPKKSKNDRYSSSTGYVGGTSSPTGVGGPDSVANQGTWGMTGGGTTSSAGETGINIGVSSWQQQQAETYGAPTAAQTAGIPSSSYSALSSAGQDVVTQSSQSQVYNPDTGYMGDTPSPVGVGGPSTVQTPRVTTSPAILGGDDKPAGGTVSVREQDIQILLANIHIENTGSDIQNLRGQVSELSQIMDTERARLISEDARFDSFNEAKLLAKSTLYKEAKFKKERIEKEIAEKERYMATEKEKKADWEGKTLTEIADEAFGKGIKFEDPMKKDQIVGVAPSVERLEYDLDTPPVLPVQTTLSKKGENVFQNLKVPQVSELKLDILNPLPPVYGADPEESVVVQQPSGVDEVGVDTIQKIQDVGYTNIQLGGMTEKESDKVWSDIFPWQDENLTEQQRIAAAETWVIPDSQLLQPTKIQSDIQQQMMEDSKAGPEGMFLMGYDDDDKPIWQEIRATPTEMISTGIGGAGPIGEDIPQDARAEPDTIDRDSPEGQVLQLAIAQKNYKEYMNEVQKQRYDAVKDGKISLSSFAAMAKLRGTGDSALTEKFAKERGIPMSTPLKDITWTQDIPSSGREYDETGAIVPPSDYLKQEGTTGVELKSFEQTITEDYTRRQIEKQLAAAPYEDTFILFAQETSTPYPEGTVQSQAADRIDIPLTDEAGEVIGSTFGYRVPRAEVLETAMAMSQSGNVIMSAPDLTYQFSDTRAGQMAYDRTMTAWLEPTADGETTVGVRAGYLIETPEGEYAHDISELGYDELIAEGAIITDAQQYAISQWRTTDPEGQKHQAAGGLLAIEGTPEGGVRIKEGEVNWASDDVRIVPYQISGIAQPSLASTQISLVDTFMDAPVMGVYKNLDMTYSDEGKQLLLGPATVDGIHYDEFPTDMTYSELVDRGIVVRTSYVDETAYLWSRAWRPFTTITKSVAGAADPEGKYQIYELSLLEKTFESGIQALQEAGGTHLGWTDIEEFNPDGTRNETYGMKFGSEEAKGRLGMTLEDTWWGAKGIGAPAGKTSLGTESIISGLGVESQEWADRGYGYVPWGTLAEMPMEAAMFAVPLPARKGLLAATKLLPKIIQYAGATTEGAIKGRIAQQIGVKQGWDKVYMGATGKVPKEVKITYQGLTRSQQRMVDIEYGVRMRKYETAAKVIDYAAKLPPNIVERKLRPILYSDVRVRAGVALKSTILERVTKSFDALPEPIQKSMRPIKHRFASLGTTDLMIAAKEVAGTQGIMVKDKMTKPQIAKREFNEKYENLNVKNKELVDTIYDSQGVYPEMPLPAQFDQSPMAIMKAATNIRKDRLPYDWVPSVDVEAGKYAYTMARPAGQGDVAPFILRNVERPDVTTPAATGLSARGQAYGEAISFVEQGQTRFLNLNEIGRLTDTAMTGAGALGTGTIKQTGKLPKARKGGRYRKYYGVDLFVKGTARKPVTGEATFSITPLEKRLWKLENVDTVGKRESDDAIADAIGERTGYRPSIIRTPSTDLTGQGAAYGGRVPDALERYGQIIRGYYGEIEQLKKLKGKAWKSEQTREAIRKSEVAIKDWQKEWHSYVGRMDPPKSGVGQTGILESMTMVLPSKGGVGGQVKHGVRIRTVEWDQHKAEIFVTKVPAGRGKIWQKKQKEIFFNIYRPMEGGITKGFYTTAPDMTRKRFNEIIKSDTFKHKGQTLLSKHIEWDEVRNMVWVKGVSVKPEILVSRGEGKNLLGIGVGKSDSEVLSSSLVISKKNLPLFEAKFAAAMAGEASLKKQPEWMSAILSAWGKDKFKVQDLSDFDAYGFLTQKGQKIGPERISLVEMVTTLRKNINELPRLSSAQIKEKYLDPDAPWWVNADNVVERMTNPQTRMEGMGVRIRKTGDGEPFNEYTSNHTEIVSAIQNRLEMQEEALGVWANWQIRQRALRTETQRQFPYQKYEKLDSTQLKQVQGEIGGEGLKPKPEQIKFLQRIFGDYVEESGGKKFEDVHLAAFRVFAEQIDLAKGLERQRLIQSSDVVETALQYFPHKVGQGGFVSGTSPRAWFQEKTSDLALSKYVLSKKGAGATIDRRRWIQEKKGEMEFEVKQVDTPIPEKPADPMSTSSVLDSDVDYSNYMGVMKALQQKEVYPFQLFRTAREKDVYLQAKTRYTIKGSEDTIYSLDDKITQLDDSLKIEVGKLANLQAQLKRVKGDTHGGIKGLIKLKDINRQLYDDQEFNRTEIFEQFGKNVDGVIKAQKKVDDATIIYNKVNKEHAKIQSEISSLEDANVKLTSKYNVRTAYESEPAAAAHTTKSERTVTKTKQDVMEDDARIFSSAAPEPEITFKTHRAIAPRKLAGYYQKGLIPDTVKTDKDGSPIWKETGDGLNPDWVKWDANRLKIAQLKHNERKAWNEVNRAAKDRTDAEFYHREQLSMIKGDDPLTLFEKYLDSMGEPTKTKGSVQFFKENQKKQMTGVGGTLPKVDVHKALKDFLTDPKSASGEDMLKIIDSASPHGREAFTHIIVNKYRNMLRAIKDDYYGDNSRAFATVSAITRNTGEVVDNVKVPLDKYGRLDPKSMDSYIGDGSFKFDDLILDPDKKFKLPDKYFKTRDTVSYDDDGTAVRGLERVVDIDLIPTAVLPKGAKMPSVYKQPFQQESKLFETTDPVLRNLILSMYAKKSRTVSRLPKPFGKGQWSGSTPIGQIKAFRGQVGWRAGYKQDAVKPDTDMDLSFIRSLHPDFAEMMGITKNSPSGSKLPFHMTIAEREAFAKDLQILHLSASGKLSGLQNKIASKVMTIKVLEEKGLWKKSGWEQKRLDSLKVELEQELDPEKFKTGIWTGGVYGPIPVTKVTKHKIAGDYLLPDSVAIKNKKKIESLRKMIAKIERKKEHGVVTDLNVRREYAELNHLLDQERVLSEGIQFTGDYITKKLGISSWKAWDIGNQILGEITQQRKLIPSLKKRIKIGKKAIKTKEIEKATLELKKNRYPLTPEEAAYGGSLNRLNSQWSMASFKEVMADPQEYGKFIRGEKLTMPTGAGYTRKTGEKAGTRWQIVSFDGGQIDFLPTEAFNKKQIMLKTQTLEYQRTSGKGLPEETKSPMAWTDDDIADISERLWTSKAVIDTFDTEVGTIEGGRIRIFKEFLKSPWAGGKVQAKAQGITVHHIKKVQKEIYEKYGSVIDFSDKTIQERIFDKLLSTRLAKKDKAVQDASMTAYEKAFNQKTLMDRITATAPVKTVKNTLNNYRIRIQNLRLRAAGSPELEYSREGGDPLKLIYRGPKKDRDVVGSKGFSSPETLVREMIETQRNLSNKEVRIAELTSKKDKKIGWTKEYEEDLKIAKFEKDKFEEAFADAQDKWYYAQFSGNLGVVPDEYSQYMVKLVKEQALSNKQIDAKMQSDVLSDLSKRPPKSPAAGDTPPKPTDPSGQPRPVLEQKPQTGPVRDPEDPFGMQQKAVYEQKREKISLDTLGSLMASFDSGVYELPPQAVAAPISKLFTAYATLDSEKKTGFVESMTELEIPRLYLDNPLVLPQNVQGEIPTGVEAIAPLKSVLPAIDSLYKQRIFTTPRPLVENVLDTIQTPVVGQIHVPETDQALRIPPIPVVPLVPVQEMPRPRLIPAYGLPPAIPPIFLMPPSLRKRRKKKAPKKRRKKKIYWDVPSQPLGEPYAAREYTVFGTAGTKGEPSKVRKKERRKQL